MICRLSNVIKENLESIPPSSFLFSLMDYLSSTLKIVSFLLHLLAFLPFTYDQPKAKLLLPPTPLVFLPPDSPIPLVLKVWLMEQQDHCQASLLARNAASSPPQTCWIMGHVSHHAVGLRVTHFATTLAQSPYLASECVFCLQNISWLWLLSSALLQEVVERVSMRLCKANAVGV